MKVPPAFIKIRLLNHKLHGIIPVLKENLLLEENGDIYETHQL